MIVVGTREPGLRPAPARQQRQRRGRAQGALRRADRAPSARHVIRPGPLDEHPYVADAPGAERDKMPVPGKGRATLNRVFICTLAAMVAVACLVFAAGAAADGITNSGDDLRTGWYPDEGAITPQLVSGNTFGQLWSAPVNGQVYAQPLLSPTGTSASPTGMLVVATETNDNVYGLDPGQRRSAMDDQPGQAVQPRRHFMSRTSSRRSGPRRPR